MSDNFITPIECPVCGEAVPRKARACPGCGADERSGWNEEDTRYDGLDLPDHAFETEESAEPSRSDGGSVFKLVITVLIAVALLLFIVF